MANGTAARVPSKPKGDNIFVRFGRFVRESYIETTQKAAWPTWTELWRFTIVVIFAVVVVAIWIGAIDFVLTKFTASLG
jgi:preprotein translocase SecE subunit